MRSRVLRLLTILVLGFGCAHGAATGVGEPPPAGLRLPDDVRPRRYDVALTLLPGARTFSGRVGVDLTLDRPRRTVWLHGRGLTVRAATFTQGGRRRGARVVAAALDRLGFVADGGPLAAGAARLEIDYEGPISRRDDAGLFEESQDGQAYLFSQFEAISARRALPCFDEPAFKVPWQLTLTVRAEDVAASNTPIVGEAPAAGGLKTVRFAETRPLPSYLVAIAVGPFDVVDAGRGGRNQVPMRILAPRGHAADARYAAEVSGALLATLERAFDVPYPYEKLDQVALPRVASFGAMENAGLITYRQSLLLAGAREETASFRRTFADVAAHEMAHQWFGDLVTLAWWDDLWLNEGFATWMEPKVLDAWQPGWSRGLDAVGEAGQAMGIDALTTARRVRQPIESQGDIENGFDGITYQKGAALLRMFESWLGPDRFAAGVRRYLRQHAYGNATAADFLAAIGTEAGRDVAGPFGSFLDQGGVPLVSGTVACDGGRARLQLRQERYVAAGSTAPAPQAWQIPVCVRWNGRRSCTLLATPTAEMPLEGACPRAVVLNADAAGYYRSGYDAAALRALLAGGGRTLTRAERLSLGGDARALVAAGRLRAADGLALLPDLLADDHPRVLRAALGLASVRDEFLPPGGRAAYAAFLRRTFGARAHALGWRPRPGEDEELRLVRPALLSLVADDGEDAALAAEARQLAMAWLDDRSAVDAEIAGAVLTTAAHTGDRALFDRLRAELPRVRSPQERGRVQRALASFRDPALVQAALDLALDPSTDGKDALVLVPSDPRVFPIVWRWFEAHFDGLVARVPNETRRHLVFIGSRFCDPAGRSRAEGFLRPKLPALPGGARLLAQALELVDQCTAQRDAQRASLAEFLGRVTSSHALGYPGDADAQHVVVRRPERPVARVWRR